MQEFRKLLHRLTDSGIEFVIVGGYAAMSHGSSVMTRDLDICTVLSPDNMEKLRRTLADWNPKHRMTPQRLSFLEHPAPGVELQNLYLETDVGVIDILTTITGVGDYERLKRSADDIVIDGRKYFVISLADLISAKEALGREKDLLVAKELKAIAVRRQKK
jgi:predicted nucleotidyltransferase